MEITDQMLAYNNVSFNMSRAAAIIDRGMGRNKLYAFLKDNGIVDWRNRPEQKYIDAGYLDFKQPKERAQDGWIDLPYSVVYVKPKGIVWIRSLLDINRSLVPVEFL
jgi:phage antirepressor YoqD-like protein